MLIIVEIVYFQSYKLNCNNGYSRALLNVESVFQIIASVAFIPKWRTFKRIEEFIFTRDWTIKLQENGRIYYLKRIDECIINGRIDDYMITREWTSLLFHEDGRIYDCMRKRDKITRPWTIIYDSRRVDERLKYPWLGVLRHRVRDCRGQHGGEGETTAGLLLSTQGPANQSINQSINQLVNQSINKSINQPINHKIHKLNNRIYNQLLSVISIIVLAGQR